jgi:hypothetical protein
LSYEQKLGRARELIAKRDELDAELADIFGDVDKPRRGRPPTKKNGPTNEADPHSTAEQMP